MSTDLVVHTREALAEKKEWSEALSKARMLPAQFQGNPANLLFAIEYADALGIERINAVTSIHVIDGKPSASAELISGMIRRAGHKLRVTGDDTQATAQLIRADDPEFTYEVTWTLERAKRAGLLDKKGSNWGRYPAAMLRARAITEVARMGASDALLGVVYTPEELGAVVDATGEPIGQPRPTQTPASGADRLRAALAPEPTTEESEVIDADVVDELEETPPEPVTAAQLKAVHAILSDAEIRERDDGLAVLSAFIGRDLDSSKDLTKYEASQMIDVLPSWLQDPAAPKFVQAALERRLELANGVTA